MAAPAKIALELAALAVCLRGGEESHESISESIRLARARELDRAVVGLRVTIGRDPRHTWARIYLAKILLGLSRLAEAREVLEEALTIDPRPHLLALLGEVCRRQGDALLAVRWHHRALEGDPALTPAQYYLSLALLDLGEEQEALELLEPLAGSVSALPEMHLALGAVYLDRREFDRAIDQFQKAVLIDPHSRGTVHSVARLMADAGIEPPRAKARRAAS